MTFYDIVCCFLSVFLSTFLAILLSAKSSNKLGAYRYLMLVTSIYGVLHSILGAILEPTFHFQLNAFVLYGFVKNSIFNPYISTILMSCYIGFFVSAIAVYALNFVYRYLCTEIDYSKSWISSFKICFPCCLALFVSILLASGALMFFGTSPASNKFMESLILQNNNNSLKIEDFSYICVLYEQPTPTEWGILGIFLFVMLYSLIVLVYFGKICYSKIQMLSTAAQDFQRQIFLALAIQTILSIVFVYIPIGTLFFYPIFDNSLIFDTGLPRLAIATYLAIIPLPSILIIRTFRYTILGFFGQLRKKQPHLETRIESPALPGPRHESASISRISREIVSQQVENPSYNGHLQAF